MSQQAEIKKRKAQLDAAVAKKDGAALRKLVQELVSEDTHIVVSRQLLGEFAKEVAAFTGESGRDLCEDTIEVISKRLVSFEEPVAAIREHLASIYDSLEEFEDAARTLEGIVLDSPHRQVKTLYKVDILVKIAEFWLLEDEFTKAEAAVNKAATMIKDRDVRDSPITILKFKSCFAQINDYKRKFLDAGMKYYELSSIIPDHTQQSEALGAAIICAVLAKAGPQRSRLLATLYKDERSAKLGSYNMLEKSFLDRIIRKEEAEAFEQELKDHHKGRTIDGFYSLLQFAVIQHNLIAASRLYNNIGLVELGGLLGITPLEAEQIASKMIAEDRLSGQIDQVSKVLSFQSDVSTLSLWDDHIQSCCDAVNAITDQLARKYKVY